MNTRKSVFVAACLIGTVSVIGAVVNYINGDVEGIAIASVFVVGSIILVVSGAQTKD